MMDETIKVVWAILEVGALAVIGYKVCRYLDRITRALEHQAGDDT